VQTDVKLPPIKGNCLNIGMQINKKKYFRGI
jgi:hypothetical protein